MMHGVRHSQEKVHVSGAILGKILDKLGEMMEHCVFDRDCGLCQN